jgi:trehalose-6-phosphate synthase
VADAIAEAAAAARSGDDDARARMAALRAQVREHDVALWAETFLAALGG